MCEASECERSDWPFGVAGVCNNLTGLCDCPTGYTGQDVFLPYNDCHIRTDVRDAFSIAFLVITILAVAITGYILVSSYFKWKNVRVPSVSPLRDQGFSKSESKSRLMTDHGTNQTGLSNSQGYVSKRYWRTLQLSGFLFIYPVLSLPYAIGLNLSPAIFRHSGKYYVDLTLALSISALYCSYWIVAYVYYKSLPNIRQLGALLSLKSPLITYPSMMFWLTCINVIVLFFVNLLLLFIIPSIFVDNLTVRSICDRIWYAFSVAALVEFFVIFTGVMFLLYRLFQEALGMGSRHEAGIDMRKVQRAMKNVKILALGAPGISIIGITLMALLLTAFGQRHVFILFFGCALGGYTVAILAGYAFVTELTGSRSSSDIRKGSKTNDLTIIHQI